MNEQKPTHYVIDINTANNVGAYLANRPIREALGLWEAFQKGQAVNLPQNEQKTVETEEQPNGSES